MKSNGGLTTKRLLKQSTVVLLSVILGSVFAIMSAVSSVMGMVEKRVKQIKHRLKMNQLRIASQIVKQIVLDSKSSLTLPPNLKALSLISR